MAHKTNQISNGVKKDATNDINFLEKIIPDLKEKKILDLGCGRGRFLVAMKAKGYDIIGIEPDPNKYEPIKRNAKENRTRVKVIKASGESLPFKPGIFDFIYCNDVLEHCKNPDQFLKESHRVLRSGGQMYLTVINRFAFRDPHYYLNFLNWMPRWLGEKYIILRRRSKELLPGFHEKESRWKLTEMHYFTFGGFQKMAQRLGFEVQDLKEYKIHHPELISSSGKTRVNLVRSFPFIYYLVRLFYLTGFRLLLKKKL